MYILYAHIIYVFFHIYVFICIYIYLKGRFYMKRKRDKQKHPPSAGLGQSKAGSQKFPLALPHECRADNGSDMGAIILWAQFRFGLNMLRKWILVMFARKYEYQNYHWSSNLIIVKWHILSTVHFTIIKKFTAISETHKKILIIKC